MSGSLFAVSDLHVSTADTRQIAERLRPESDDDGRRRGEAPGPMRPIIGTPR